jgi:hypothetical protein
LEISPSHCFDRFIGTMISVAFTGNIASDAENTSDESLEGIRGGNQTGGGAEDEDESVRDGCVSPPSSRPAVDATSASTTAVLPDPVLSASTPPR